MPTIKRIIETTERTVENLITKDGEFQFLNGGFVREGVPYHIHYTVNKKEYYMTGPEHHPLLSKLMIRRKNDSIFSQYINVFPAKREKYLEEHSFELTEGDLETEILRDLLIDDIDVENVDDFEFSDELKSKIKKTMK